MADEDTSLTFPMSKSPSTRSEDRGHPERKRRASEDSCEVRETIIGMRFSGTAWIELI